MVLGVEDYPRTLSELEARFGTEQARRDYLLKLRWPEGVRLSKLRHAVGLDDQPEPAGMCEMPVLGIANGGHHLSGHAKTADAVVPGDLGRSGG